MTPYKGSAPIKIFANVRKKSDIPIIYNEKKSEKCIFFNFCSVIFSFIALFHPFRLKE